MKVVLYFMVMAAGFAAHSAINSKSNADCLQGKKSALWENTTSAPKQNIKSNPAPTQQQASTKAKAQNT